MDKTLSRILSNFSFICKTHNKRNKRKENWKWINLPLYWIFISPSPKGGTPLGDGSSWEQVGSGRSLSAETTEDKAEDEEEEGKDKEGTEESKSEEENKK